MQLGLRLLAVTLDSKNNVIKSVNASANVVKRAERRAGKDEGDWEEEVKVSAGEISADITIINGLATVLGTTPMSINFDAKKWFLQLGLLESTKAFMSVVTLNEAGDDLIFWEQKVMPMGASPSSSIAQRCLDSLIWVMMRKFQEIDRPYLEPDCQNNPRLSTIMASRQALESKTGRMQAVMACSRGFTDDCGTALTDSDRAYRMRAVMFYTVGGGGANVLFAPKWNISPMLEMVGVAWLLSFAVTVVQPDKRVKAITKLDSALKGTITWADYRKLYGLLWFILSVVMLDRHAMNGLIVSPCPAQRLQQALQTPAQWWMPPDCSCANGGQDGFRGSWWW